MPKLLLIQPSQYSAGGTIIRQKRIYLPGLVFPLLASLAPKNWEVEIRLEVIEDIDFNTDADIVGIGAMGHSIFRAFDLAANFRKRNKIVFMGGCMASLIPDTALEHVDSVVVGDGERSFPLLLKDFEERGFPEKIYNYPLENLDGLPVPRYELLIRKKIGPMLPVQAGRGCPHTCTFCSIACIYKGRYMLRPMDEVMNDIIRIRKSGYRSFFLIDDNIVGNPEYLMELSNRIKSLKMTWSSQCTMNLAKNPRLLRSVAASGCKVLSLGIESITQEGLNKLNKNWLKVNEHEMLIKAFHKAGILVSAEMMVGTDSDTEASLRATYDFIMKTGIPLLRVYILTPIPGTAFYDEMKAAGRLVHEDYTLYTASNCVHHPALISAGKLREEFWRLNHRIFSYRSIITRTLFNTGFMRQPGLFLYAAMVNLHYRSYVNRGDLPIIL